jgi:hypothetical protein
MDADWREKLCEPFDRDDVQWRAQTVTRDGDRALALAYFDARAGMDRLDEVCGPENWQCRYVFSPDGKKTICEIGILVDVQWVWKADGAGDSDVEAEKGALSDAFKRAAVRWGIGRYLYRLGQTWVPCESTNGKFKRFTVDPWTCVRSAPDAPAPARPVGQFRAPESSGDRAAAGALVCSAEGCGVVLTKGQYEVSTRAFGAAMCPSHQRAARA